MKGYGYCRASREYFAERMSASRASVGRAMKKLRDSGLIERLDENGGIFKSYMYLTGRITDRNNSRYRPFRVIIDFCINDIYMDALDNEYYAKYEDYDADTYEEFEKAYDKKHKCKVSDKAINEYVDNIFYDCYAGYINSYTDCKEFYQLCNDTFKDYNNRFRRAA